MISFPSEASLHGTKGARTAHPHRGSGKGPTARVTQPRPMGRALAGLAVKIFPDFDETVAKATQTICCFGFLHHFWNNSFVTLAL
jgi:hypothetical protein